MRVYLSAAFHRQKEMQQVRGILTDAGVDVQARWIDETIPPQHPEEYERFLRENAYMDMNDVYACDILVRFSDDLTTSTTPAKWATGSRMEETGMAHVLGKTIIIVGGKQSIFDRFPQRVHVKDIDELLVLLARDI